MRRRAICFVTGTRAEFGLMGSTLRAIQENKSLQLQIVITGMHLDRSHGDGARSIRDQGWKIDGTVAWPGGAGSDRELHARNTGRAMASLAETIGKLRSDIVMVAGDRVEAFAAAAAGHLSGKVVAHVHGGDRAAGQADDCLRHAISKLAHIHFPGTALSRDRLIRMGEDPWRIKSCGSPGIDGIVGEAATHSELRDEFENLLFGKFALIVLHPTVADDDAEKHSMTILLDSVLRRFPQAIVIHPNNDPGCKGIRAAIEHRAADARLLIRKDVNRNLFLGLMREARVLIGNSSSGIIEAASFGLPVIDLGPRQRGREHGNNVVHAPISRSAIARSVNRLLDGSTPSRSASKNVYGRSGAGRRIAHQLATLAMVDRLFRKLIAY